VSTEPALPEGSVSSIEHGHGDLGEVARLQLEVETLRRRLHEAEETLEAIRSGSVDAFLIERPSGQTRVYTLQGAERPYRVMVESMHEGALALADDGAVLFGNGAFARLTLTPSERLAGAAFIDFVAPRHRPTFACVLERARVDATPVELALVRSDMVEIPVLLWATPLPLGGTAVLSVIVSDLTERKERDALQMAEEALRLADRRKDEFLATLAHELRNPLAPMRSAVHILRLTTPSAPDVKWAHDVIDRQIQQMTRHVDDLLDLSRISRNQLTLRREQIEVASIVQSAIETSQPLIDHGRHVLTVELPPRPLHVDGDHTRLAQVFANLLNNAAKYTDDGGRITLSATEEGGEIVVTVRDDGVGIAEDLLPHIFDMYTQVDRTVDRSQGGLGIGLTLVRRLVQLHGGSVHARSAGLNRGSEFQVRLPRLAVLVPDASAPPLRIAPSQRRFRMLVVDDNVDSADSLGIMLRLMGNDVEVAYGGMQAVEFAGASQPEVVLLDLDMPKMSGYEACRLIRELPSGSPATVIALTGYGQAADRQRTREHGFDHHIVKPVDAAELMELLGLLARGA
jgi:PAS domain S-box-containing protein